MEYADPVTVPRSAGEAEIEAISLAIEEQLNEMTARIDAELGG